MAAATAVPQISQMSSRQLHYFDVMQAVTLKSVYGRWKRELGGLYVLKQSNAWPEPNDFVATRYPPPHLREQNKYGSDNPVLFSHNNTDYLSAPLCRTPSRARCLCSHPFVMEKRRLWPVARPKIAHILKRPLYSSGGYVRCATAASSSAH